MGSDKNIKTNKKKLRTNPDDALKTNLDLYRCFYYSFINNNPDDYIYHITNANKILGMKPETIRERLDELEEAVLGIDLYIRTKDKRIIGLTSEGEQLYKLVDRIIKLIIRQEKIIRNRVKSKRIRIGIGDTLCKYYLMDAIQEFTMSAENSKIPINILNPKTQEIISSLESGKIHIGIITDSSDSLDTPLREDIEKWHLTTIHSVFVASESSSQFNQLKGRKISIDELATYRLLLLNKNCHTRKEIDKCLKSKIDIDNIIETECEDILLEMATRGLGIALVSKASAVKYAKLNGLFIIDLKEDLPDRKIYICYMNKGLNNQNANKFIDFLLEKKNHFNKNEKLE